MKYKRNRNLIAIVLTIYLFCTLSPAFATGETFTDIGGHWAEAAISRWMSKNILKGYLDGSFRPDAPIKRAEFAALINRIFGFTTLAQTGFSDVKGNEWFAPEIKKAVAAGYMNGYPEGTFRPEANISRQEAAVVLARVLGLDYTE